MLYIFEWVYGVYIINLRELNRDLSVENLWDIKNKLYPFEMS